MSKHLVIAALIFAGFAGGQRRVDPRNTYDRVICIVQLVGTGTAADPKRPQYAPWSASTDPNGIIGYYFVPTDDGKSAVVEFVARNRAAFQPLFNDKTIKLFEKGKSARTDIEAATKQVRKDFNLDTFGMVM
jgi:hypothetical protein